jgi:hypothetical protein
LHGWNNVWNKFQALQAIVDIKNCGSTTAITCMFPCTNIWLMARRWRAYQAQAYMFDKLAPVILEFIYCALVYRHHDQALIFNAAGWEDELNPRRNLKAGVARRGASGQVCLPSQPGFEEFIAYWKHQASASNPERNMTQEQDVEGVVDSCPFNTQPYHWPFVSRNLAVWLEGVQAFCTLVLSWVEAIHQEADLTRRVLSALETRVEHLAPLPARLESGGKA